MDGHIDGWTNRLMDKQMNGQIDGWTNRWMDKYMDGRNLNGQTLTKLKEEEKKKQIPKND